LSPLLTRLTVIEAAPSTALPKSTLSRSATSKPSPATGAGNNSALPVLGRSYTPFNGICKLPDGPLWRSTSTPSAVPSEVGDQVTVATQAWLASSSLQDGAETE